MSARPDRGGRPQHRCHGDTLGDVLPELRDGVIALSMLTSVDVAAVVAGEDDEMAVRLSGARATPETTRRHIAVCAENWRGDWYRPEAKLAWGIRDAATGALAGTADLQLNRPDLEDGAANLSYGVFPEWRGRRYAARAVRLMCGFLTRETTASVAVLRIEADNAPSIRVALACRFERDVRPTDQLFTPSFIRFNRRCG